MSEKKYTDEQYLEAGESYFEGDEWISNQEYKIVKTRKEHICIGLDHKDDNIIPVGSKALREKAIHVDYGRVSCYVCIDCLNKWCDDVIGVYEEE